MINLLLKALSFRTPETFDPEDTVQFREVVKWLENSKIRVRKVADRKDLEDVQNADWDTAFKTYLKEVECPLPHDVSDAHKRRAVLTWLLQYAVHLVYSDTADAYNQHAAPLPDPPSSQDRQPQSSHAHTIPPKHAPQEPAFPDCGTPETLAAVKKLASVLHIPTEGKSLQQLLEASRSVLSEQVLPVLAEAAALKQQGKAAGGGGGDKTGDKGRSHLDPMDLGSLPLGFETGDAKLDAAARVLRLLFVKDLRAFQSQVDQAIVDVQELCANPRTDSSLGKVGR